MWSNGYNPYANMSNMANLGNMSNIPQADMQPNNWLSQSMANGMSNPFGLRFDNYMSAATSNPFAGQAFQNTYQPYGGGYGYQFRG